MDQYAPIAFAVLIFTCGSVDTFRNSCTLGCDCTNDCPAQYAELCMDRDDSWMHMSCEKLTENTVYNTESLLVKNRVTNLQQLCISNNSSIIALSARVFTQNNDISITCIHLVNLLHLDLSGGNLTQYPFVASAFPNLKTLNLSNNAFGVTGWIQLDLSNLEVLDLSHNSISNLKFSGSLPRLKNLLLHNNSLRIIPPLPEFTNLNYLDISYNEISIGSEAAAFTDCKDVLPSGIGSLVLRGNKIKSFPDRNCRLLDGMTRLKTLDLGENKLSSIPDKFIHKSTLMSIETLLLDRNDIYFIPDDIFMNYKSLGRLSLSENFLNTISSNLLQNLNQVYINSMQAGSLNVLFSGNPFECNCDLKLSFQKFTAVSHLTIAPDDIVCAKPSNLEGEILKNLSKSDLNCPYFEYQGDEASQTCLEGSNCDISCDVPYGRIYWLSPTGDKLSIEALAKSKELNDSYFLHDNGQKLTISEIPLWRTGMYRCISNSSFSSTTIEVEVSILPNPLGSIIAIAVSSVSFALAIAINCFNMCKCYCEALSMEEDPEPPREEVHSPLKPSKQRGFHESEASLNANKYYRKYDFACQHVFLDTVLKGAHTVKQTLYDARNSEFSNNVWEYATHLRDRLHIELPSSVHMPRVSMPSISLPSINMPSISMPSMPNLQSINSNIERLGTSVKSRSHNLASSVGSVFTLRWLKYGANENDSDSESEHVSVTQVQVHVHEEENSESSQIDIPSSSIGSLRGDEEHVATMQPLLTETIQDPEVTVSVFDSREDTVLSNTEAGNDTVATFYQFETAV